MSASLRYTKQLLTLIGSRMSKSQLYRLHATVNYLSLGRWMSDHGFRPDRRLRDRWEVFETVASKVADKPVLYLEFGVYQGESIRYWAARLRHPDARLHGFDSFEGLQDDWGPYGKGQFDMGGRIPTVDDPRVTFFKGRFSEVLPTYVVPEHEVLVVVMDADLYSSTSYVLRWLHPHIRTGTFIYFDEIVHVDHEAKAFDELMKENSLAFRLVCADRTLVFAFFECTGPCEPALERRHVI
jgi:hypothetical protein